MTCSAFDDSCSISSGEYSVAGMPGTRASASTKSRTNFLNARPDSVLVTTSCAAAEAVFRRSEAPTTNSVSLLSMEFKI